MTKIDTNPMYPFDPQHVPPADTLLRIHLASGGYALGILNISPDDEDDCNLVLITKDGTPPDSEPIGWSIFEKKSTHHLH